MDHQGSTRVLIAAALVASAGLACSALSWTDQPETGETRVGAAARPGDSPRVRFNFSEAPFAQVLDFFSRQTGLPVIREAEVPPGSMSFISAADYSLVEAMEILNLNLALHGRRLVREQNFLFLRTTEDAARKPGAVFGDEDLSGIDPTQYLTITIPLSNANVTQVAEKIKPLVKAPGLVTAVETQNMLLVVETAGQCARIREIVRQIDSVRPVDSEYRIFTLRHAKAATVVQALRGLVGQRILKQIIEKDGSIRQVEEVDVAGLNIQADERLNAVIAVGSASRIETVEELVALLDAPEGGVDGGGKEMATFRLRTVTAEEATGRLNALFQALPENRKPTLIPLETVGKLAVVGERGLLAQATALLGELDGGANGGESLQAGTTARVIRLEHATAATAESIARRMLTPRQTQVLRFTATADGQGVLVSGPPADVDAFEGLIRGIDTRPEVKREVRIVTIPGVGPARTVLDRALELDRLGDASSDDPITATLEESSRSATLVGSAGAILRFEGRLREAGGAVAVRTVQRTYTPRAVRPSELAQRLGRLARPMLAREDGGAFIEPVFEGIDELDTLVIRAEGDQFAVIDQLIATLDVTRATGRQLRVVPLGGHDPEGLLTRALSLASARAAGLDPKDPAAERVETEFDALSGNLIARGTPEALALLDESLREAQRLIPPERVTRILDLRNVTAESIVEPLRELLTTAEVMGSTRAAPEATIRVIERTNSLLVTAEAAQQRSIEDYVRRLDTVEQGELPPLRLLQVRTADVNAVSAMLSQQYDSRPLADRTARPVQVRADAATGTLIVSAHPELFGEIREFVEELNRQREDGPERATFIFPLKVARAVDVAAAMDKLYPQPPMPVDRRGVPMPWLQQAKEVTVSADPSSNSLIIDAPAERRESLVALAETLDRVELPEVASLRTYRIERADLGAVASMLTGLARRGTLSGPAQSGKQKVEVVIEVEPRSNTLIVAGDEVTFEKVEQILDDLTAVPVERGLRIIPVANADAADVRSRALAIYAAQIAQIPGAGAVDVSVDASSNSIEVVADAEAMGRFLRIIDELQRQVGPAREVRLIELRLAKAEEVIEFLRELVDASEALRADGGARPVFEAIVSSNAIMAAAQPGQFPIIEHLIRSLDNQQTAERPPLRIIRLRTTDAGNVADILQRSFAQRRPEERQRRPVDIQADAATNSLVVSAHPEMLPEIEEIVASLNEAQSFDREGREIRIFPLRVARAEELAKTIDAMYPEPPMPLDARGRPLPHLQGRKEVAVRADPVTNSLIVDAPGARLSGFEQIVTALDKLKVDEGVELRTYRIERADLNAVSATLRTLGSSGALGATGTTPVTVSVEPMSRAVIVSGPVQIFERVEAVIAEVDGAVTRPATVLRMYPLRFARAERMQGLLDRMLRARLRESMETSPRLAEELLEIAADNASNTLIISGPAGVQEVAEQLIAALDTEASAAGKSAVKVIPLMFAEAGEVARSLSAAIPSMELPSGGAVSVVPAAGSNALLLAGASADLEKIETLIEPLDRQAFDPGKPAVETFPLAHADATEIARTVERLLIDQQQTDPRVLAMRLRFTRGMYAEPAAIRVEAERRTNALIVSGPAETIRLAKAIIERLDEPAQEMGRTVLTFTPAKGDPAALAQTVSRIARETMATERRPLEITAEAGTGSVLVIGSATQTAEAIRLLAEFDDRSASVPLVEMRSFALSHAEARAVAGTVQQMLGDRSRWPETLLRGERAGLNIATPTVQADAMANRVLVSVPGPLMGMATELIETLDQPRGESAVEVRVFRLTRGDAASAANALRETLGKGIPAGEPAPIITAEPSSNTVVVAATSARLSTAGALIESMDEVAVEPSSIGVRTIFLRHARAESVAPIVERVLSDRDEYLEQNWWARWQLSLERARRGLGEEARPIRVAAERRLNAVVVSAPLPVLELAEQVVAGLDLDPEGGPGGGRVVRVITLTSADAGELSSSLDSIFGEHGDGGTPPTVRVDRSSNSLIVSATAEQMTLIEGLSRQLDQATLAGSRQMRSVRIDRARIDAEEVARTLRRLLEQQGGVRVEVIGVDELLRERDRGGSRGGPSDDRWSPGTPAGGMIRVIERLMAVTAIAAPVGEEPTVTIAVDPVTNTLVLIGSDRITARLAELAKELEKQSPQEATAVRVVRLPDSADPRAVAGLITQSFQQIGRASDDNPGGFTGRVAVSPDVDGGAVIVWANDTDFRAISELIAGVARLERTAEVTIKVYPLTNIDARGALRAVQDLLSTSPTGRQARRLRELVLTIEGGEGDTLRGSLDPTRISMTSDPAGRSLIVSAPADSIDLLDRFIGLLDQSPVTDRMEVRRYALDNAEARTLSGTIQALMDAKRQGAGSEMVPRARLVPDERTNSLLVTATRGQHDEIGSLIASSDVSMARTDQETVIIPLSHARPTAVARIVEQVIVGRDPARRDAVQVSAQDDVNLFVVKAEASLLEEIRGLVAGIDVAESASYPVRSIKLERANAGEVAAGLQRFFQQRARIAGSRGAGRSGDAAIYGDRRSGTVVVAASDDDFEQIKSLVDQFDAPSQGRASTFRIIPLRHASVNDITQTVQNITAELQWERMWGRNTENAIDARVLVESNRRTNSIVVFGEGEIVELIERVVGELDQPISDATKTTVRAVFLEHGDPMAIKRLIERVTASPDWGWWRGRDPQQVQVEVDAQRRLVLLIGDAGRVEEAMGYIGEIEKTAGGEGQIVESIVLRHAEASRAAASLTRFFRDKARAEETREDRVAVVGSRDGNLLIVSAPPAEMATLRDLVAQIDQPELGEDRRIEVYSLRNTEAGEIATTLRTMFPPTGRVEDRVIVTPQPSRGVLIVSAPEKELERVGALVSSLDTVPDESGLSIVTVPLNSARAGDVATSLRAALPAGVKITITPVERSNALLLTGSDEAIRLVMKRVEELDSAAVQPPVVFRRFELEHAEAADAAFTLRAMVRNRPRTAGEPAPSIDPSLTGNVLSVTATPDEMGFIEEMIGQIDAPDARTRRTEFVTLEYARAEAVRTALGVFYGRFAPEARGPAERNVRIVADQTANSLLITGDESVFEDIRALLARLDTPAYDTSRQLVLIPLKHADAASVARSLNEGFRAPLEQQLQREQFRLERDRRGLRDARGNELVEPTVLVSAEETPSVSAEPVTNTLIVFASRREIERIERIVAQLDVPEFQRLPRARLIPVTGSIRASRLAERVREVFLSSAGRERSSRVVVVGDDSAGVLIVRAEDASFEEIRELTLSLLEAGETATPSPRIIRLKSLPAARVRSLIANVFGPIAQQRGETLTIEIDRDTNALVIAASEELHRQIRALTDELDGAEGGPDGADEEALPSAGVGQSVGVFELKNTSPQTMALLLARLGLTGPQAEDRPGVVGEPIRVTPLTNRRAVAVLAGSADLDRVGALIHLLDASGVEPALSLAVVPLKSGEADRVVSLLEQLIRPATADGKTEPAAALAEQVRRLSLIEGVFDRKGVSLDLATPIKLLADGQSNAVIIASSEDNVRALEAIIPLFDRLPAGDAVVVRIFPLEHASATRAQRLLNELFARGDAISRLPGTRREGQPTTTTGRALRGDIALTVDERTNALLVAGREEAVALVEVLVADLDSPQGERGWIEGEIVRLQHADAVPLANKLREVLIRGVGTTPEAIGLREQIGRLRLVVEGRDAGGIITSDLYASMSRLVIEAEENLNALIVIGTPTNIGVVRALVEQLDVEQAAAGNTVRVIPLQRASADRVAGVLRELFTERSRLESVRAEDRLIISVDARTNALIVSTSPRSFAVLEKLIETLDRDEARFAVGLHVIPVPGADVADLAPKIRRLMVERLRVQQRRGGLDDPLDAFSIEAVPAEDLLIVAASDENLALIRELIDALRVDRVGLGDADRFELIPIESPGGAIEMARAVDELYVRRENEKRGRRSVSVVPSERQNAILVSGTADDIEAIRALVKRLDRPDAEAVMEVKRIQLRAANSLEIVRLVEGLLAGRPIAGGRGGVQATRLRFHQLREEAGVTEATIDAAVREQVRLTPDLRTNSVMVSAPPAIMALIEEVIRDLDAETSGDREIVRYRLENADAQQMALLLRDLFNLQQQGDRLVLVPRQSPEPEEGMPAESGTFTPVPDLRQALAITIDRRTNTLLVSGTREYLAQVRQVVEELDKIEANEREQLVYALKNAQASEIQRVLVDYFRGEAELRRSVLGPGLTGSLARQLEQEVTVVGDAKSNKVLVSASPRYIDTVRRIIEELDATPPQVMIQVLLAEVTLDNTMEWGLDFNIGLDVATSNIGGDGYVINSLAAGAGVATALGVPNLSVASTDFDLLIRALEVQGKLEVLSRPQVTVNNNEPALIQVGENVSIVTGSNQFQDRVSAVTERRDVGIIMNVTPSISPDGFVRMEIKPSISQVSQRTTQIDENFESPIITERRVETTVTVRDGQTVVIGGLIQTQGEERVWKVPLLGDIPLVGNLFKSTKRNNVKTELLVMLRPVVIPGDGPTTDELQGRIFSNAMESLDDASRVREALDQGARFLDGTPVPMPPLPEAPPPDLFPERMERIPGRRNGGGR